jgi:hypothetical protein
MVDDMDVMALGHMCKGLSHTVSNNRVELQEGRQEWATREEQT